MVPRSPSSSSKILLTRPITPLIRGIIDNYGRRVSWSFGAGASGPPAWIFVPAVDRLEQRRIVLNALFGCTLKRAPSLNTLRTVLQMLDRDALEEAFRQHARDLLPPAELGRMPVVALDGKTLKGSFDHLND